ncbi:hypothetical protein GCK72_012137 [Caenorhabditis remanei]|uniref:Uncharacterized protein n=1 Tax=Caenorhabditis remanei TaxID=31234 RepID=A0A6A5GK49_CAERE|nr:hypothetical protein GCK72_012137 [Caenorhabditis remanei]KAF1755687.1 hypothetical protein GCK72_012137 [Caenorhabditis remanei]
MKILLTVGVILVCDYTVLYAQDNVELPIEPEARAKLGEFSNSMGFPDGAADQFMKLRQDFAQKAEEKAKFLKWNNKLKIPDLDCDTNYDEETNKMKKELEEEHGSDYGKLIEAYEEDGEETDLTCLVPSRTEINCKSKKCDKKYIGICICGPKKCDVDDDGLCESGSLSVFTFGVFVNFCIFYLIVSFF